MAMLKKLFLISIALACIFSSGSHAQNISRKVISTTGGTLSGGSNQITFTIGETVIPTLTSPGNIITQGFQQPGEQIITGVISSACAGGDIAVPFTAIDIGGGNVFTAELSDANGNFSNPAVIGNLTGNESGTINATIPFIISSGNNYKIRVVASVPLTTGSESPAFNIFENPVATIAAPTSMICNDSTGTATANVAGGTPVYLYEWSNGATTDAIVNLNAGTYIVTVTDANGCADTSDAFVLQQNVINALTTATSDYNGYNISCYGASDGEITILAFSTISDPLVISSGPFEYTLNGSAAQSSNIFTGLSAGTYIFTVTDLSTGCTFTGTTVPLTEPSAVIATATVNNNGCFGGNNGSATATGSGGTGVYTYSWLTPVPKQTQTNNEIPPGTWQVVVTDSNGCSDTTEITIIEPPQLTVSLGPDRIVLYGALGQTGCTDIIAAVNGGTLPYNYAWSATDPNPAIPGMNTGTISICNQQDTAFTYTVLVTDANGCTATASVTLIFANINCSVNQNNTKVKICLVPPGNPANCQTICVSVSAVPALLATGSYLGNCQPNCAIPARIITENLAGETQLNVYPNPTNGRIFIEYRSEENFADKIALTDIQGRIIDVINLNKDYSFSREIDISTLQEGVYFINVMGMDNIIKSSKIVKLQ